MKTDSVKNHAVVSHEEWLAARTAFLEKEKEFTRLQDQLTTSDASCRGKPFEKGTSSKGRMENKTWRSYLTVEAS